MKKLMFVLVILALLVMPSTVGAKEPCKKNDTCTTIQDGTIYASTGELITTGYDEFGHIFLRRPVRFAEALEDSDVTVVPLQFCYRHATHSITS